MTALKGKDIPPGAYAARPSYRLPLSAVKCTDCGAALAEVIVTLGGTRHACCGQTLEGIWTDHSPQGEQS